MPVLLSLPASRRPLALRWSASVLCAGAWALSAPAHEAPAADVRALPVGSPFVTTSAPAPGWLYACPLPPRGRGGGAHAQGPWFNADGRTWDATRKIAVQGSARWDSELVLELRGTVLDVRGNGLPNTPVGQFPVSPADPAFAFDRNPNSVRSVPITWGLPATPEEAAQPTCLNPGAVGVLLNGARLFHAADELGRDAVAWEVQDQCQGHPEQRGAYHHHSVSSCLAIPDKAGEHSPLVGYIADGFGLYGPQGEGGKPVRNADLDACHGHRHALLVRGVPSVQYHYHQTPEFPYTVGCYKGTPARVR